LSLDRIGRRSRFRGTLFPKCGDNDPGLVVIEHERRMADPNLDGHFGAQSTTQSCSVMVSE
jgi:hypothetical protein